MYKTVLIFGANFKSQKSFSQFLNSDIFFVLEVMFIITWKHLVSYYVHSCVFSNDLFLWLHMYIGHICVTYFS